MSSDRTLMISRCFLAGVGTQMFVHHQQRIPQESPVLVVSNHRSFLDPLVLTAALGRSIRFACHHYMGQVPVIREVVTSFGAFPLEAPEHRQQHFFAQATALLQDREMVGVFPEGAEPMVNFTQPNTIGKFQRGFAHLALRAPVRDLAVLPVAIASMEEKSVRSGLPLKLLSLFDPSEPLFDRAGWHPVIVYQRVNILIGRPYWITVDRQQQYRGKKAKAVVAELTEHCQGEIAQLLDRGCV
ncbi:MULTISPECIES: lysophospholipid acyltransferase family protein [unclassified Microcoleus]|uniref:lysophospholipid acyltransferase family protein n=1 Tax=unclassified Microcoleus TaxID=2642155 RepID=UPI001E0F4130|nr:MULTISPECIES: lysophospholipid acyltransferase family protein [unclassified Microcoleus]MCC3432242.1 1-acyl-sn-glycerol-3-phosphate acyltransferase [Microcoleus sp. PH2017_04_SCI_O_A]MCC3444962.1 1-acyl-sn-glycerol-3-phosphate acyltransferase [Microcoleus sp. PH2017_03_ELD_O_A]MCC3467802.1 1-acyl-sn-glycerol-3-phosphate acyltransferase [Microcoleus sp. PH2017_06_SFM_O_A]MCC3502662.1 1-acyl-sn-glycerol-3-phosphate acyltransferase [Microcoleus sp. PH2017_19_SFW_U_A]TAE66315.1 MAG: 1-acyl-sn-g